MDDAHHNLELNTPEKVTESTKYRTPIEQSICRWRFKIHEFHRDDRNNTQNKNSKK